MSGGSPSNHSPAITSWQYKYNGEVIGIDIVYPFRDWDIHINRRTHQSVPRVKATEETKEKTPAALLMVDALTRFVNCSILPKVTAEEVANTFVNDWVRCLGKPRRIILDHGGPGFTGREWRDASHVLDGN